MQTAACGLWSQCNVVRPCLEACAQKQIVERKKQRRHRNNMYLLPNTRIYHMIPLVKKAVLTCLGGHYLRVRFDWYSHQHVCTSAIETYSQNDGQHNLTRLYETSEGTTPFSSPASSCRKYLLNTSMTPSVSPSCKKTATAPTRSSLRHHHLPNLNELTITVRGESLGRLSALSLQ